MALFTRNRVAFLGLAAVTAALSYYIYDFSASGWAYLLGMALPFLAISLLVAFGAARRKKSAARADIAFALTAAFLLWANRAELYYTYDLARFRAEVRASPDPSRVLQESTTEVASLMRAVNRLAEETKGTVSRLFESATKPIDIFASGWTNDPGHLAARVKAANDALSRISQIPTEIDQILAQETVQATELVKHLPDDMRRSLLEGLARKRSKERPLTERSVDQLRRLATLLASMSDFLLVRADTFSVNEAGTIVFTDPADMDELGLMSAELAKLVEEGAALDAEVADYEKRLQQGWANFIEQKEGPGQF